MGVTGRSRATPQLQKPLTILTSLITSKTRLKLLLKFFSRPDAVGHLRGLAEEFGDSTNSVRVELQNLEEAGLLQSVPNGQKIQYRVNRANPFYADLVAVVSKYLGFDELIENLLGSIGDLKEAYVVGDYATGVDSGTIELVLVGQIRIDVVDDLIPKVEQRIGREITYTVHTSGPMKFSGGYLKIF
jgi:hypothetical protein